MNRLSGGSKHPGRPLVRRIKVLLRWRGWLSRLTARCAGAVLRSAARTSSRCRFARKLGLPAISRKKSWLDDQMFLRARHRDIEEPRLCFANVLGRLSIREEVIRELNAIPLRALGLMRS